MIKSQPYVSMDEATHTYSDPEGNIYQSMSKFLEMFSKKFDREGISKASAKKAGVSQEEILAQWDKKRDDSIDHGNRFHHALERFSETTEILPTDEDIQPAIVSINKEYCHYYRVFNEHRVWNKENKIAGTSDKKCQITSHKASIIDFGDFKTNLSKGIQFSNPYNQYMLGPLSHLQDCNFVKYNLQLTGYAWMEQQLTGCKIGKLFIHFIPPHNPMAHYKLFVPYMKREFESMLEYKQQVSKKEPDHLLQAKTYSAINSLNPDPFFLNDRSNVKADPSPINWGEI